MIADKWGGKPAFVLGMIVLIITMVGYSQATSLELVLLIRALESISSAILMPTTRTMVADMLSPENRGFGTGLYSALVDESATFGAIFGGYVADLYDFKTIFFIGAATAAVCVGIVLAFVPEPAKDERLKVGVQPHR
jgi:MFS family permease